MVAFSGCCAAFLLAVSSMPAAGLTVYRLGGEGLPVPPEVASGQADFVQFSWAELDADLQGASESLTIAPDGIAPLFFPADVNIATTVHDRGGYLHTQGFQAWIETDDTNLVHDGDPATAYYEEKGSNRVNVGDDLRFGKTLLFDLGGLFAVDRIRFFTRAFRKARDLDTMPWRAPTAHNAVIRAVAAEHGAVLADVEAAFGAAAPASGVGWEWMVDHVHFSVAGQALLARTVLGRIAALEAIDLALLRSEAAYRRDLGDLPVERVVAYNKMGAMLAQAPLHQYNGHNARYLKQLAVMERQRLSPAEWRGVEQWVEQGRQGPLVLAVADQLFTARDFARAQAHYAAALREVPFTRRGLWAAVQWGWCLKMQGMALTDEQRHALRAALKQAEFLARDPAVGASFVDFAQGQFYHLLGERDLALLHLERAFWVEDFRRRYALSLFQALASELVWAGRAEDAREYARLVGAEVGPVARFLRIVEEQLMPQP